MSPKSTESPSVAISLYSIILTDPETGAGADPQIKTERVELLVDHFAKEVVNFTLKNTNGDFNLTKSIFFKAASYIQKQIKEMENEDFS